VKQSIQIQEEREVNVIRSN